MFTHRFARHTYPLDSYKRKKSSREPFHAHFVDLIDGLYYTGRNIDVWYVSTYTAHSHNYMSDYNDLTIKYNNSYIFALRISDVSYPATNVPSSVGYSSIP